jgi:chemotaxis protein MotB
MGKKDAHHGGAWKVAYADFVTAMMALFIVLWICKEKPKLAAMIALTFHKPLFDMMAGGEDKVENAEEGTAEEMVKAEEIEDKLEQLAIEMQKLLNVEDDEDKQMDFEVNGESLMIDVYDRSKKPLFEKDTANLTKWGAFSMEGLSWIIERHKMSVVLDGHLAAGHSLSKGPDYGVWELSLERANACRRALLNYALEPKYIFRVTGFGDSRHLPDTEPNDAMNDRIRFTLNFAHIAGREDK